MRPACASDRALPRAPRRRVTGNRGGTIGAGPGPPELLFLVPVQTEEVPDRLETLELARRVLFGLETPERLMEQPRRERVREGAKALPVGRGKAGELRVTELLDAAAQVLDRGNDREVAEPLQEALELLFQDRLGVGNVPRSSASVLFGDLLEVHSPYQKTL